MKRTPLFLIAVLLALIAGFVVSAKFRQPTDGFAKAATEVSDNGRNGGARGTGGGRGAGAISVVTALAASRDVPQTENSVGWVEPIASVEVQPRIDGIIVDVPVTDGQNVKTGDLLFRLDDKALQATLAKDRATLAKDQASAEQLQADLKRLKTLHGSNFATEQQVEQQQASLDEMSASILGDQAQIQSDQVQLDYTSITAPIDGRIGVINFTLGNLVHPTDTTPLLTLTQMAPLRVSFPVPERDLDAFRQAVAATPAMVRALDPDSGTQLSLGRLNFIDSSIDTTSGTVTAKADFENSDGVLWPGEYVRVEVDLGVHRGATVVPMVSVQLNEKGSFVFLVKPNGTVAMQNVTVTQESGDTAIIGSGVNPGDHVVVEGQLRLQNGSAVAETVASADAKQTSASSPPEATP